VVALGDIIVVGLKASGAGGELDALAAATGGSVQPLSSDGANIGQAILDALAAITTDVWWEVAADSGLTVTLNPEVHKDVSGGTTLNFTETIEVADDAPQDTTLTAVVTFIANSYPDEGAPIGREVIRVYVPDVTPPEVACLETVNPHGRTIPPAGSTTLPGPKGGQNEDGFYELLSTDNVDPDPELFVIDSGSGTVFGPFASGTIVKYTEDADAVPEAKKIGSDKGNAEAVDWHIIGNGDLIIMAVDDAGNAARALCLVPPLPK
jgi:hypothetical protein